MMKIQKKPQRRTMAMGMAAVFWAGLASTPASAQSLIEAMALAYETNPDLVSARAELRAVDEQMPQARSGFLPTLALSGDVGQVREDSSPGASNSRTPYGMGVTLTQPVFRGGGTVGSIGQAENTIYAQRAALLAVEQQVLLSVVTAYLDVLRDRGVVDLNRNNERVLDRQLQASRDRFRVGEVTRTDVSQSEARVSRALADRITSEGELAASVAAFERAIGISPENISVPELAIDLPSTLEEVIEVSLANNPSVVQAEYGEKAARDGVTVARSDMLPEVNVIGSARRDYDPSALINETTRYEIRLQADMPLYQGGGASARVREARQTANQARADIESVRREVTENAIRAWEGLLTARAEIEAREAQVEANEIALEGTQQEALVGSRTVLDILDAEQELFDARVALVSAQRDERVATFQVLASLGLLTVRDLGIAVEEYDMTAYYDSVARRLWGTSID